MISPEDMLVEKRQSLSELGDRLDASGMHSGEFFTQEVLRDNQARAAGGSPHLDAHQREYLERIVGPSPTTPEQRAARLLADTDAQLARGAAADRWRAFISEPSNVDRLIALAGQAPEPTPVVPPWLRDR